MKNFEAFEAMAKLSLPENERLGIARDIEMLEQSFAALAAVDTGGVENLVTVLDIRNVLREDIMVKNVSREELLSNAPEQYDGYFQVPKTLE